MNKKYLKPTLAGFLGILLMALFYFIILFIITGDIVHPIQQFIRYKYWMSTLLIGFGVQFGLFWYIRSGLHLSGAVANSAISTGAGSSALAMAACCAHHILDLLPILGLSASAIFLSEYQEYFFLFGILSNIAGIALMVYIIKTKKCFKLKSLFNII